MGWRRTEGNGLRVEWYPGVEAWRMEESLECREHHKGQHHRGVDQENVPLIAWDTSSPGRGWRGSDAYGAVVRTANQSIDDQAEHKPCWPCS